MADSKKDNEVVYAKSTAQLDLEERLARQNEPVRVNLEEDDVLNPEKVVAPYKVEDNDTSAYRGVSPEYMTYADDRQKPFDAEEGVWADAEKAMTQGSAVSKPAPVLEPKPTVGGGSSQEVVYSATSGEGYTAELVDREKVHAEETARQLKERQAAEQDQAVDTPVTEQRTSTTTTQAPKQNRGLGNK